MLRGAIAGAVLTVVLVAPDAHAVRFRKGPYLQNLSPTAITIMWQTDEATTGIVRFGPTLPYGREVSSGKRRLHEVRIDGLEPNTQYHYQVEAGEARSRDRTFTTACSANEPFRFLVYGDNRDDHEAHRSVIEAMLPERADLVFNTGDMVGDGSSEEDWQVFFDVERRLLAETTIFPVIGNHEALHPGGRKLFRRYFSVPLGSPRPEEDYAFSFGNSRFIVLTAYAGWPENQLRWIDDDFVRTNSDASIRHRFVLLHHGPYSSGYHGGNARALQAGLGRVLREGRVDIVFSGHDHDYERGLEHGVKYVVSGGGGAPLYDANARRSHEAYFEATHHFVRVDVTGDDVEITAIRPDGSVADRCGTAGGEGWNCARRSGPVASTGPAGLAPGAPPSSRVGSPEQGCPSGTVAVVVPVAALAVAGGVAHWRRRRRRRGSDG